MPLDFASIKEISLAIPGWQRNRLCRTAPGIWPGSFLWRQDRLQFLHQAGLPIRIPSRWPRPFLFFEFRLMISSLFMSIRAGCSFIWFWNWAMNSAWRPAFFVRIPMGIGLSGWQTGSNPVIPILIPISRTVTDGCSATVRLFGYCFVMLIWCWKILSYYGRIRSWNPWQGEPPEPMTAADIILIFIGIIGLLIAFGSFVIALLAFLDRDKDYKRKKIMPTLLRPGWVPLTER